MKTRIYTLLLLCGLVFCGGAQAQQSADVSQVVLPIAEIYDLAFIGQFLEEQLIYPENASYTSAAFLDVTNDGFGTNDLLLLYPSLEQFPLGEYLPEAMLNALVKLNLEEDYRLTTVRAQSRAVTEEAEVEENPRKALASAFLRSLLPYYPEGPIEIHLRQKQDDVNITLWGYEPDLFEFVPQATMCTAPPSEPMMVQLYAEPEIRSRLDADGCVIVERWTTDGKVVSRSCE